MPLPSTAARNAAGYNRIDRKCPFSCATTRRGRDATRSMSSGRHRTRRGQAHHKKSDRARPSKKRRRTLFRAMMHLGNTQVLSHCDRHYRAENNLLRFHMPLSQSRRLPLASRRPRQ